MSSSEINGIRNETRSFGVVKYEKKYREKIKKTNKGIKKEVGVKQNRGI